MFQSCSHADGVCDVTVYQPNRPPLLAAPLGLGPVQ